MIIAIDSFAAKMDVGMCNLGCAWPWEWRESKIGEEFQGGELGSGFGVWLCMRVVLGYRADWLMSGKG